MNWLSILILAIPVVYIFSGVQKGMIRTAFSFVSVILTLILSFALNSQITGILRNHTPIYDMIQENCEESIAQDTEGKLAQEGDSQKQNQFIQQLPVPDSVKNILIENNNSQGYQQFVAQSFGEYVSHAIATIAVSIIGMIVTFVLISVILHLAAGLLNGIFSLPILSFFNHVGGALLGAVQGIFIVWIIFLVLSLFWDTSWAQSALAMIKENSMTDYLYENNLVAYFLSQLLQN